MWNIIHEWRPNTTLFYSNKQLNPYLGGFWGSQIKQSGVHVEGPWPVTVDIAS